MELRPVQQPQRLLPAPRFIRDLLLSVTPTIWDRPAERAYPRLTGDVSADACVVGLGGSGLAAIDELLNAGLSVVGIDAATIGGAAAGRNGGLLRAGTSLFYHDAVRQYGARALHMYAATVTERERIIRRLPSLARRCGYLRLASDETEAQDCWRQLQAMRDDGHVAEQYEGPLGVGVLVPGDAVIDPLARCRAEAELVSSAGARLFEHSRVIHLSTGLVETEDGRVRCRLVIVAVDGALGVILPELEDRVWPMRLQMLATGPHQPGLVPHAIGTRWGWDYGQQLPNGTIAFGGCRDVGGAAVRTADTAPTPDVQEAIERRFAEVTGQAPQVTHRWTGTGGYTADGLPIVEEVRPGIWATGGYNGTGNLVGAACAREAVNLALKRASG